MPKDGLNYSRVFEMDRVAISELDGWICTMLQKPVDEVEATADCIGGRNAISHSRNRVYVRTALDKKLYVVPFVLLDKRVE